MIGFGFKNVVVEYNHRGIPIIFLNLSFGNKSIKAGRGVVDYGIPGLWHKGEFARAKKACRNLWLGRETEI